MNETSKNEILESLRAIKVAAADRRAALLAECAELEAAFPDLAARKTDETKGRRPSNWSPAVRAAQAERMRQKWATARANGQATLKPSASVQ